MKRAPRSRQRHDLYAKYHDYDSEISDLLGECGWTSLLVKQLGEPDMLWLSERFDRFVPGDLTLRCFDIGWSAVFTSAIDPRFARRFETRGRQPESILSKSVFARVSRSTSRPPIHFLFGRSDETVSETRAPRSRSDLVRRVQIHTSELLNRVAETATQRGLVVIAGFEPNSDWLELDSLLASLSGDVGPEVVWFAAPDKLGSAIADEMISNGSLITTETQLTTAVQILEAEGRINIDGAASPDEPGTVTISTGVLDITPALRLRVEASASIVDDSWTQIDSQASDSDIESSFRTFHGDLGNFRTLMEGVHRGFAIERSFESNLWKEISELSRHPSRYEAAVILHGQSGTGKSVAIARLVIKARQILKMPVLVVVGRLPNVADIDAFCIEAERCGALSTLVVCDANQPYWRYHDLSSALQSRGRRVLVVGTSYRLEDHTSKSIRYAVEAKAALDKHETKNLNDLVAKFSPSTVNATKEIPDGWSALAWLYRNLSAGRQRISSGLNREARQSADAIRERAKTAPRASANSALAEQLISTGLVDKSIKLFDDIEQDALLGKDSAGRLIDLVMVAGRIGCAVPLNLLIRVLNSSDGSLGLDGVAHLFKDIDLFRWKTSDAEGSDLTVAPRIQLEAELICQRRLADSEREIDCLIQLIRGARSSGVDRVSERRFLIDLLQKLDRDGPRGTAYSKGYLRFADALRSLREEHGVVDASLMLRECVFRRQAIFMLDGKTSEGEMGDAQRLKILNDAREVVEIALREIDDGRLKPGRRTRLNLIVERASIYGYLAVQRTKNNDPQFWSDYMAARSAGIRATSLSDDYHPFDVSLWTAADVLREAPLSDEQRADLLADLYSTIDVADSLEFRTDQKSRYLERRRKVAELAGNFALSAESLKMLEEVAPDSAAFLQARERAATIDTGVSRLQLAEQVAVGHIADWLDDRTRGSDDQRCLRLLFKLRWLQATGEHFLVGERARTPSSGQLIGKLLEINRRLVDSLGGGVRNQERYLGAVLTWLSGDYHGAIDLWRSLSIDTEFEDRSRIVRRLVATDSEGLPLRYRGRVEGAKGQDDWKVRVEGVTAAIPLLGREFAGEDLAAGRELRDFGIAFNYVGPIADPLLRPMGGK
jgi:hypothetical protein